MQRLLTLIAPAVLILGGCTGEQDRVTSSTSLTVQNRSGYHMINSFWRNGKNCSGKMFENAPVDINAAKPSTISVPAGQPIAVGVAIHEMRGKPRVLCDYILSFTLSPSYQYKLQYEVGSGRCFGQLFRQEKGAYKLVAPGDPEGLTERFPEFGWDQFEPGCAKLK